MKQAGIKLQQYYIRHIPYYGHIFETKEIYPDQLISKDYWKLYSTPIFNSERAIEYKKILKNLQSQSSLEENNSSSINSPQDFLFLNPTDAEKFAVPLEYDFRGKKVYFKVLYQYKIDNKFLKKIDNNDPFCKKADHASYSDIYKVLDFHEAKLNRMIVMEVENDKSGEKSNCLMCMHEIFLKDVLNKDIIKDKLDPK